MSKYILFLILLLIQYTISFNNKDTTKMCNLYSSKVDLDITECNKGIEIFSIIQNKFSYHSNLSHTSNTLCNKSACFASIKICSHKCSCDLSSLFCNCCPLCTACMGGLISTCCDCIFTDHICRSQRNLFKWLLL